MLKSWTFLTSDQWLKYQPLIFLWLFKDKAVLVIQDSSDAPSICINTEEEKCATDMELWSNLANTTHRLLADGGPVSRCRVQSCALFIAVLTSGQCFPSLLIKGCTVPLETKYQIDKEKYSQKVCCNVVAMFFISNCIKNRLKDKHPFVTFISPLFCSLPCLKVSVQEDFGWVGIGFTTFVAMPPDTQHQSALYKGFALV